MTDDGLYIVVITGDVIYILFYIHLLIMVLIFLGVGGGGGLLEMPYRLLCVYDQRTPTF